MFFPSSEHLPDVYRELIESGQPLVVSGQPLNMWTFDHKDFHFYDCPEVVDMPFVPCLVSRIEICPRLNPYLPTEFTGDIVVVIGQNPDTQDEYRFGVRDELNFCLSAVSRSMRRLPDHLNRSRQSGCGGVL